MKYVILVGDGMGDYPIPELNDKTPLQAADIPHIRRIAAAGNTRLTQTVPQGMSPGSDVANLGLMGYDASKNYTGRAPIEAAGAGIPLAADEVAFRCNLVTIADGCMVDYSSGHITTEESSLLLETLQQELGTENITFHTGISYRHLLVWKQGAAELTTQPPHDIADQQVESYLPAGDGQSAVRDLMEKSASILAGHPVNRARVKAGKRPATQIWLWGQGRAMTLASYRELYGLSGGVITAVDLVRGLGQLAGLSAPVVEGATGFIDTNYEGKVQAALNILQEHDFVYVHIEAPDECGHMGDAKLKTEAIEAFDAKVVGPIWEALQAAGEPYRLFITTDHRTPVSLKGHTAEPVPISILDGPVQSTEAQAPFDEFINEGKPDGMAYDIIAEHLKS